jgi:hypothetical protein
MGFVDVAGGSGELKDPDMSARLFGYKVNILSASRWI